MRYLALGLNPIRLVSMNDPHWRKCHECGQGLVRLKTGPGRHQSYKNLMLEVPAEVPIPTCDQCATEWHNDESARTLEDALEVLYRAELKRRLASALDRIFAAVKPPSQTMLEKLLGLSPGYISKIRLGERDASATLVSELALIARDPERRLSELRDFWKAA